MKPKNSGEFMSQAERLAIVETTMMNINSTLADIKQEMRDFKQVMRDMRQEMNQKFDYFDKKFDQKFDRLDSRMWVQFFWLMSMILGLAGLIAHAHDWI